MELRSLRFPASRYGRSAILLSLSLLLLSHSLFSFRSSSFSALTSMTMHFPCHTSPSRTPDTVNSSLLALPSRRRITAIVPVASFKVNRRDGYRDDDDDVRRIPRLRERYRASDELSTRGTRYGTFKRLEMHDGRRSDVGDCFHSTTHETQLERSKRSCCCSFTILAGGRQGGAPCSDSREPRTTASYSAGYR